MHTFIYLRTTLLFFFILTGVETVSGNDFWEKDNQKCDSLKNILNTQILTPKQKLDTYLEISYTYSTYGIDSLYTYAMKVLILAQELNEYEIELIAGCHLGTAYFFKGEYEAAINILEQTTALALKKGDKLFEAKGYSLMAYSYTLEGKYNTAIDFYLKGLSIFEEISNTQGTSLVLINIGKIYRKLNNPETALRYMNEAIVLCEKLNEENNPLYETRMANLYNDYAAIYLENGQPDKATGYALKADSLNPGEGIVYKCHTKTLLAKIYLMQNEYERALEYASEAMAQADILKDTNLLMNVWLVFSDIYMARGRYGEAEEQALIALQTDSTDVDISRKVAANLVLANIYMQNTEKAAHYFKEYSDLNELFSNKSFQTTMSDMSVKYETDKKEMRIASLEKEKQLYVWMGIAGILFAVSLGVLLWQNIKNTCREKQLIAARFLQDGEMGERERIAADLHDRLLGSLSAVKLELNNTAVVNKLDNCIDEIRRITHNLMPLSLRFGLKPALEDFTTQLPDVYFYFFGQEKRIGKRLEFTLYCCANELVTNSIRHSGAKNIHVQLIQRENHISLTVQDNGCGFNEKSVTKGIGLKNIRDRVALYNGKIDILSSPGNGTETTIEISVHK